MGKSLRSKPKLRAKSVKRAGEFTKYVESRNDRIAQRMKANLEKQKAEAMEEDNTEAEESKEEKKIKTSGWRNTSRQRSKQKKSKKKKDVTRF